MLIFFSRWFCHFDDDNYVNVPALLRKLREFDHREDWYLGKPSIPEPLEILDRDNMQVRNATSRDAQSKAANSPTRNLQVCNVRRKNCKPYKSLRRNQNQHGS